MTIANVTVKTASGQLRGVLENGIYSFKGIPYGEPPAGENRFRPPLPVKPWTGIRDASKYGPAAWQPVTSSVIHHLLGYSGLDSVSEDCLALNVWTQGLNDHEKRPVMVWLHGGGFFMGSGDNSTCYEGASLARKGVVVVSVNHRLGVFGFLYLRELAGEKYSGSGNAGMLDLVQALKWINANITNFGGDPENVTIFGESGGGTKVSTLMALPSAKGLFQRAIIESGPGLKVRTAREATQNSLDLLKILGIKAEQIDKLSDLRASEILSAGEILAPRGGTPPGVFSPVVDDEVLPAHPFYPAASPFSADIPLLIGSNKDESIFMMMNDPRFGNYDESAMRKIVGESMKQRIGAQVSLEKVDGLIAAYHKTRPGATPHDILIAITTDLIRVGSIWLAERKAAAGKAPVYMYLFTWESPLRGGFLKSPHTLEMPFVFNNLQPEIEILGNSPDCPALSARMSDAWVAFARNGDPNHAGIPHWPAYDAVKRSTMLFDTECRVQEDPFSEERKAWS